MKKNIKNYKEFLKENTEVLPDVKPTTTPRTTPNRPSPIRRDKPSVIPKPKAEAEEKLIKRFLDLIQNNDNVKELLKNKYE